MFLDHQDFFFNILLLTGIPLAFLVGYFVSSVIFRRHNFWNKKQKKQWEEDVLKRVENQSKELKLETELYCIDLQKKCEQDIFLRQKNIEKKELRLQNREDQLVKKLDDVQRLEFDYKEKEKILEKNILESSEEKEYAQKFSKQQFELLEKIGKMSSAEAKEKIIEKMTCELEEEKVSIIKKYQKDILTDIDYYSKNLILKSLQKYSEGHESEFFCSSVLLPNDTIKGRVIGREGRNVRAFEEATGVTLLVDDSPEVVRISCFDPFRRSIAKISLEALIKDGRIHPPKIEETVSKVEKQIEEQSQSYGERLLAQFSVDNVHPDLIKIIGRFYYQSEYGQNLWIHLREVCHIMISFASELSLDRDISKRVALFHLLDKDGFGLSEKLSDSHNVIYLLKEYKESKIVLDALSSHWSQSKESPQNIYAVLLKIAKKISFSRPGSRRSDVKDYIDRLQQMEELAKKFKGVQKAFALKAGRELRVLVSAEKVDDNDVYLISRELAALIEKEFVYPGPIKVSVVRKMTVVEYAR